MERIDRLYRMPEYQALFQRLQEAEKDRIFCNHTLEHFLDTARLMYIENLENGLGLDKELIYAAAFLHDIGRIEQIEKGTPHDEAGARLAGEMMEACGFSAEEIRQVQAAILGHRKKESLQSENSLEVLLYRADKKSRCCFACAAAQACNWSFEKRNLTIEM